jgi:hypothetical protein
MSHQDLLFALQDREKPGFNKALNPLPTNWNKTLPQNTDKPSTKARQPSKAKLPKVITLPAAHRRFYTTRTKAEPFEEAATFAASLPLILARALDSVHSQVNKAFTVSINPNGTVSVLAAPSSPAVDYVKFFTPLTNTLNAKLPLGDNPLNSFNITLTTADYAIHNLPVHILPSDRAELLITMRDAIGFATGACINTARFRKPDLADRTKSTTSVMVSITPDQALLLKDSIIFFFRSRKCEKMFSASLITQCRNCCKFGHPAQVCKQEHPTCPIYASCHSRNQHRCGNQGCVKERNDKPVPG